MPTRGGGAPAWLAILLLLGSALEARSTRDPVPLQSSFTGRLLGDREGRAAGAAAAAPPEAETRGRSFQASVQQAAPSLRTVVCLQHSACPNGFFCASDGTCKSCDQCQYNQDSIDGACPTLRCPNTPTEVAADVSPPILHWLYVDPTSVDVSVGSGGQSQTQTRVWVTMYMMISDDGVGYSRAEFIFASSSQSEGIRGYSYAATERLSGDDNFGVYKTQFWFEYGDEGATWKLYELWLSDLQANNRLYGSQDIFLAGQAGMVNATIEVKASQGNYVACVNARYIRCTNRNAACVDVRKLGMYWAATCACNQGFYGDSFACLPTGMNYTNTDYLGLAMAYDDEERAPGYSSGPSPPSTSAAPINRGQATPPTAVPAPPPLPPVSPSSDAPAESWSVLDTRIAMIILVLALSAVLCLQCRRYKRLIHLILFRRRNGLRIGPDSGLRPSTPSGQPRDQFSLQELWRARQEARPNTHAWMHNFAGNSNGARHNMNPLSLERQFELMQIRQIHEDARRRQGGTRASRREAELEAALAASVEWGSLRNMFSGPPQPPPPIALPQHLMLPGTASSKEEIPDGEECAVCMERKRGCKVHPCGHTDLCDGCAEHIFANKGHCPMCRGPIQSITRRPDTAS